MEKTTSWRYCEGNVLNLPYNYFFTHLFVYGIIAHYFLLCADFNSGLKSK